MKIVVTGAGGHIGACLVRRLITEGHEVLAISRHASRAPALTDLPIRTRDIDIRDTPALQKAFARADRVYHLAARISITGGQRGQVRSVNVDGAFSVARAALAAEVPRFIHVASIHAFAQSPFHEPLDETRHRVTDPKAPSYDRSKALGEKAVRNLLSSGLDAVFAYPCGVIGPFDFNRSFLGQTILKIFQGKLPATVQGGFNWVDVRDIVDGLIRIGDFGVKGEGYLLGGSYRSVKELALEAARAAQIAPPFFNTPYWLAKLVAPLALRIDRMRRVTPLFTPDSIAALRSNPQIIDQKARLDLGYRSRPLEETLRDTYSWWVAQGVLPALSHHTSLTEW